MSDTNLKELNNQLDDILKHYLVNCSSIQSKVQNQKYIPELEIRFGTNPKVAKPISYIDYHNVVQNLRLYGWKSTSENMKGHQMLRIIPERLNTNIPKQEVIEKSPTSTSYEKKDNSNEDVNGENAELQMEGGKPPQKGRKQFVMSNIRAEVDGTKNIQEYCQFNDLEKIKHKYDAVKFTKKNRVINPNTGKPFEMVNFEDFNFRVAYMEEEQYSITSNYMPVKKIIYDWPSSKKTYRSINRVRFYHPDYPIFVDISIVKTNKKIAFKNGKFGPPSPAETIQESDVFHSRPIYEIELELDNNRVKTYNPSSVSIEKLRTELKQCIRYILSGLQETPYPIAYSEQDTIIQEYMCRLYGESWKTTEIPKPFFIGPQSVSLQLENMVPNTSMEGSSHISITENYTVTEKADGMRALLYVSNKGKIYLITSNLKVLFTGSITKNKLCWESLLDGEFIEYGKAPEKKRLFLYAAFDIYYFGGMQKNAHVRPLPFSTNDDTALDDSYRYSLLKKFMNMCEIESVTKNTICEFRMRYKHFEQTSETQTISQACAFIWAKVYDYEIDGLIFTPMNTGVGSMKPNEAHELNGRKFTWEASFKWKPPQYNTIDFLVETQKTKDGQDQIRYIAHDGNQMMSTMIPYKTLILRVGFDKKRHKHMNAFHDTLYGGDEYFKQLTGDENEETYTAMPFVPSTPYDPDAYLCNIELEKDTADHLRMKTLEGDTFEEDMVVEFQYINDNPNKQGPWKWVPLRVRQDKTQALQEGKKSMNNYTTANTNWRSIHFPVTEKMIVGKDPIPEVDVTDTIYYNLTEKSQSTTTALRDFHNMYIKRKLVEGVASYLREKIRIDKVLLMDFAVGKAGDLSKWSHSKINFVFGVDVHEDNITNSEDGACVRYLRWKQKNKENPLRAIFLEGNSSLNIRSEGTAFRNQMNHEIAQSIFGQGKVTHKKYTFTHGIAHEGFHISACMFALHYFFENIKTLHSFLKNIAECTRLNGYFIGTCFDGNEIFKFLYKRQNGTLIQKNESVRIDKNQRKMFEITKKYDAMIESFPTDSSSVGMPILVYQESIDKQFMEYLVNFEYFKQLMENYGFILVDSKESRSMGFHDSSGLFDRLYGAMKYDIKKNEKDDTPYRDAPNMSSAEKTVSFLNRYFIFKKVRELSQTSLNQMQNILMKEDAPLNEDTDELYKSENEKDPKEDDPLEDTTEEMKAEKETIVPNTVSMKKGTRKKIKNSKITLTEDMYSPETPDM